MKEIFNEEEKKAIELIKEDIEVYKQKGVWKENSIFVKALRNVLNLVEKQDKIIDEMAEHILMHSEHLAKYFCEGVKENVCESRGSTIQGCNYCIRQYFYRKVEDNEIKN